MIAGFVLLTALTVSAATVNVRLAPKPDASLCVTKGSLVARASDGDGLVRVPLRDAQKLYPLSLPAGDPSWEIVVEADGCWSDMILWTPAGDSEVSVALHRAGTIGGIFETEGKPARELRAFVFPVPAPSSKREPGIGGSAGARTPCHMDFPKWTCTVPAGLPFDLRLELPGYGAIHYWSVVAAAGQVQHLNPQRLYAGASISGWVKDPQNLPLPGALLSLYPLEAEDSRLDRGRIAARRRSATTNSRGFFQFSGLEPGPYRLVSEAKGFSPATVQEARVREGESLVWPNTITHVPFASLEVSLYPATDRLGKPWTVELSELAPLHLDRKPPLRRPATDDGRWSADRLRADLYRVTIHDAAGSELEGLDIDLGEGGPKSISLNVRSIVARGVLRMGEQPLRANLEFTNLTGNVVRASTAENGTFDAVFPTAGKWTPAVIYPLGNRGSTITLEPVEIAPPEAGSPQIDLLVPGARIRGEVVGEDGSPERAVVRVRREGRLTAQVLTEDGKFDFIGMKSGAQTVEAEGQTGSTPEPVKVQLKEDEAKDVRLVLAPYRWLKGTVLTPFGRPASGAVIQVLRDQGGHGNRWSKVVTDVAGQFEYRLPAASTDIRLIALTYAFPSAMVRVPAHHRGPITIQLKPEGGILRVRNTTIPFVRTQTISAPFRAFYFPEPLGRFDLGIHLEPGAYLVCPDRKIDSTCKNVTIAPGSEHNLDFKMKDPKENAS